MRAALSTTCALVVALTTGWTMSCAGTEDRAIDEQDASIVAPGADAADAGCDGCEPAAPSCDEVDFCPAPLALAPTFALASIWGSSANDVWAVGSGGSIAHYDGASWTMLPSPSVAQGDTFHAVWGSGPNDVWVVGSSALILHGTGLRNGAAEWTSKPILAKGYAAAIRAIWGSTSVVHLGGANLSFFDESTGFLQGNHARTTTAGAQWEIFDGVGDRLSGAIVRAIWGTADRDLWMAIDKDLTLMDDRARGSLMHGVPDPADSAAIVWSEVDYRSNYPLSAIWGSSATDLWAVGQKGTIVHLIAGKRAEIASAPTDANLHRIWGSGPSDVWAVGDDGTILHFDGAAWTSLAAAFPTGKRPDLYGVWGSGPNDVWVVGDGPPLHFTGRKGGQ